MAKDSLSVKLTGATELQRAMDLLPNKLRNRVVPAALRAAGAPIRTKARALVPRDEGDLRKSIGTKLARKRRQTTRLLLVGARDRLTIGKDGKRKNPAKYAHLVEFGTLPHKITAKGGWLALGGAFQTIIKEVDHPGAKKKPFMRPAYNSGKAEAIKRFQVKGWELINKAIATLPKGKG